MLRTSSALLFTFSYLTLSCSKEPESSNDTALQEERKQEILKKHAAYEAELIEAEQRERELEAQQQEIARQFEVAQAERKRQEAAAAEAEAKALAEKTKRERYAARKAILHKKMSSITLRDGTRYLDVEIIQANDIGITITHRHGARRVVYSDLPYSLQLACKFSPNSE